MTDVWPRTGWVFDYASAQERVSRHPGPLLVYYSEARPGRGDALQEALRNRELAAKTGPYVRCRLYVSHEPDRRFVGQYGVNRAPAWIVIHEDGTYHSRMGAASPDEVVAFLDQANAPGDPPIPYSYLPSPTVTSWLTDWTQAEEVAERERRPILAVYTRWLSRDWTKLDAIMDSVEVRRAGEGFVRCRIAVGDPWREQEETRFGRIELPALVAQRRDGAFEIFEHPNSAQAVVEFLRRGAVGAEAQNAPEEVMAATPAIP